MEQEIEAPSFIIKKMLRNFMAGETGNISRMANKVADEIFKKFKWSFLSLEDENFQCCKPKSHSPSKESHTHPVDVVLYYLDPYTNRRVFFNTDLKSYSKNSIKQSSIRSALKSLAQTIDCARLSSEWRNRYSYMQDDSPEVRGMLFVYNHDGEYHKNFYNYIKPADNDEEKSRSINLDGLAIQNKQALYIVEPKLISYLTTIVNDMSVLHHQGNFPAEKYSFFYPDLRLHKTHGEAMSRPATIEMLTGPYLIIKHQEVQKLNETSGDIEICHPGGYVIYYNRPGSDYHEFMYFFDMLSNFQILDSGKDIRVRVACADKSPELIPNFQKAISSYCTAWGFDDYKKETLESIKLELIEIVSRSFSTVDIGWSKP
tara:strand:+ start:2192 stop:3310 length:1119 start_codon:yes stop_codon:yes gene_type:complete